MKCIRKSVLRGIPALITLVNCSGGGGSSSTPATPVAISLSPSAQSLAPGLNQAFTATVTGNSNTSVAWSIQEGATGGLIDAAGTYTAPSVLAGGAGTFHIIATSQADSTKTASAAVTVQAPAYTAWTNLPTMSQARYGHTVTALKDGRALICGGAGTTNLAPATATADLYIPASGTISPTGSMSRIRAFHTAVLLPSGKVLISGGGINGFNPGSTNTQELFDPATGSFSSTGNMLSPRTNHGAVLLPNGKVLLMGGSGGGGSAELYDPATGTCAATGAMSQNRVYWLVQAVLMANGKVLVGDGGNVNGAIPKPISEIYDPATGTFSNAGPLLANRNSFQLQPLLDGRVVAMNGDIWSSGSGTPTTTSEMYDPATNQFSAVAGTTALAHFWGVSVLRADGRPMAGSSQGNALDVFNPATNTFSSTPTAPGPFGMFSQLTRLPGGKILATGGSLGGGVASNAAYLLQ